jgi:hypothetical protein
MTDSQKIDILFKEKFNKSSTLTTKNVYEEINTFRPIYLNQLYCTSIPNTPAVSYGSPGTDGSVTTFVDQVLSWLPGTISFQHNNLKNSIPYNFGDGTSYNYVLKRSDNTVINFSENNWVVDNFSGILTFLGGFPTNVSSSLLPKISFFKYIGTIGNLNPNPIDLQNITTNVLPTTTDSLNIGSTSKRWLTGYFDSVNLSNDSTNYQKWIPYKKFDFFGSIWSSMRSSANIYFIRKKVNADVSIISCDITDNIRTIASMGFKVNSITIIYNISSEALNSITATLNSITYSDNSTPTTTLIPTTTALVTALSTSLATPYAKNITITSPTFLVTNNSTIILEINMDAQDRTVLDLYGLFINYNRKDS